MTTKDLEKRILLLENANKEMKKKIIAFISDAISKTEDIKNLEDENQSLWDMLDEIKASDVERHSQRLQNTIDKKLAELKLMQRTYAEA